MNALRSAPLVVAHRGIWRGQFVENSTQAFEAAGTAGFPSECDVQASADGEPVVIHDDTLDRTTNGSGPLSAFTSQQVRALWLRDPASPAHLDGPVPLLADVAHLVSLVEVKPEDSPDLIRRVIGIMAGRKWLLQSFDERNLIHARQIDPSVPLALLVENTAGIEAAIDRGWTIHLDHPLLDRPTMRRLRDRGMRVGVWTVNQREDIIRVIDLGVDVIITDDPALATTLIRERHATKPPNSAR